MASVSKVYCNTKDTKQPQRARRIIFCCRPFVIFVSSVVYSKINKLPKNVVMQLVNSSLKMVFVV